MAIRDGKNDVANYLREVIASKSKGVKSKANKNSDNNGTGKSETNTLEASEVKGSRGGSWWCLCGGNSNTTSNPNSPQSTQAATLVPIQQPIQQSKQKYNCFLSHNWGNRKANGSFDNHERVRRVYQGLQSKGISCWFDSEKMTGTVQEQMSKGIDDSDCVVGIFLYFYFNYYYNCHNIATSICN